MHHKKESLSADFVVKTRGIPLCHISEVAKGRQIYQHHASDYYAIGTIVANGKEYKLSEDNSVATLDYTLGIYPIFTSWKWITGGGISNGHRITFNVAIINKKVTVGGYWVDGKLEIKNAQFENSKNRFKLNDFM